MASGKTPAKYVIQSWTSAWAASKSRNSQRFSEVLHMPLCDKSPYFGRPEQALVRTFPSHSSVRSAMKHCHFRDPSSARSIG